MSAALLAFTFSAQATEYFCTAPQFKAYLVFDDGPGGLDYDNLIYKNKKYDLSDRKVIDPVSKIEKYEYGGSELAIILIDEKAKIQFTFEAKKMSTSSSSSSSSSLVGKLTVVDQGVSETLELICTDK